ncbi:potassium-transporting ATPase subunit F [Leucobacter sp. G161]|nr:potassium-transporting ATPase subunit F [Leucobacter sp. G161]KUF07503.1 potassium-transporting ATPase [Leucobacter sp. G161]
MIVFDAVAALAAIAALAYLAIALVRPEKF